MGSPLRAAKLEQRVAAKAVRNRMRPDTPRPNPQLYVRGVPRESGGGAAPTVPGASGPLGCAYISEGLRFRAEERVTIELGAAEFDLTDSLTFRANILAAQRNFSRISNVTSLRTARVPVTNPFYIDPIGTRQPAQVTYNFVNDVGPQINDGRVRAISTSAGLEKTFGERRVQFGGAFGIQKGTATSHNIVNSARLAVALADTNSATSLNVFGDGRANNPATIDFIRGSITTIDDYNNWSAALRGDGPLFRLPAGDVRLGLGAEYRRERYNYFRVLDSSTIAPVAAPYAGFPGPRHVKSIYTEMLVPVFGSDNAQPGFHKLDLTIAGRIEDYNQFGRTENPKFSGRWEPVEGMRSVDRWQRPAVLGLVAILLLIAAGLSELGWVLSAGAAMAASVGVANMVIETEDGSIGATYFLTSFGQRLAASVTGDGENDWATFAFLWAALVAGALSGAAVYIHAGALALWLAVLAATILTLISRRAS